MALKISAFGIFLPSYQQFHSKTEINLDDYVEIEKQNYSIWSPLYTKFPDFNSTWNLSVLGDLKKIDMTSLIQTLESVQPVHVESDPLWTTWNIVLSGIVAVLVLGIIGYYIMQRCIKHRRYTLVTKLDKDINEESNFPLQNLAKEIPTAPSNILQNVRDQPEQMRVESKPGRSIFHFSPNS